MNPLIGELDAALKTASLGQRVGKLASFNGLVIEARGPDARLGEVCMIESDDGTLGVEAEVVGFRDGHVQLMPYGHPGSIAMDSRVRASGRFVSVPVGDALLGRVLNAFGQALDGAPDPQCTQSYPLARPVINPLSRAPIDEVLETGVRALDGLLTMGVGQRVGIFAGSGVGKSTLLGMLACRVKADVIVMALIGERGREVGDFLDNSLGPKGRQRSVVIAATADEPALVRVHAAHAAHAIAEFFRDQGRSVLLMVDSMTRFAMAQREIGLAVGEPPTFRGYTPTVFARLPMMLERCGKLRQGGAISGIYTVLVEGDDMNDPVADHMRAILDGHVVLSRDLAARGHLPAIDVLQSNSRLIGSVASQEALRAAREFRRQLATYESSRDLIELGAYQKGVNLGLDAAVELKPAFDGFLQQATDESTTYRECVGQMMKIVAGAGSR